MNIKLQIIIAVLIVIALTIIINMIRRKKLELKYALTWLCVGVGILVLDIFPQLISFVSSLVGIEAPVNMLFFFGFVFSLIILFVLTIVVSRMSIRIKRMAQEIALLEKRIQNEIRNI